MQTLKSCKSRFHSQWKSRIGRYSRYQHSSGNNQHTHHGNTSSNFSRWFGGASGVMLCASVVRYMEPKTMVTFSDTFEYNDSDILELIHTGYHKWRSQRDKYFVFYCEFTQTFVPHFCFAVYRKKYGMDEALELERQNLNLATYDLITSNDFPFHYNRTRKRMMDDLKREKNEQWETATKEEREQMYRDWQGEKRRESLMQDMRRIRTGIDKNIDDKIAIHHISEQGERNIERRRHLEAEQYVKDGRDPERERDMMLQLMESDEAMNSVYIIHLKFLVDWTWPEVLKIMVGIYNDFGLLNYATHTEQTLSCVQMVNAVEDTPRIHAYDDLLIVMDEPNHEFRLYYKDNWIPNGFDGCAQHITSKNRQKQSLNYQQYMARCDAQPYRLMCSIKSDLLAECFKVFFLQNSQLCRVTTPSKYETEPVFESQFEKIKNKYGLD